MKRSIVTIFLFGIHVFSFSQSPAVSYTKSFSVSITNPAAVAREAVMINITPDQIAGVAKDFNASAFAVWDGGREIPSQFNRQDMDYPGIVFVLDKLDQKASRKFSIRYNATGTISHDYIKRTQAELSHKTGGTFVNREYIGGEFRNVSTLRVPPEHKDHSWFIRYEGPGWESDKVGYRFYLDQRDATDVFGKTTDAMVLQNVGLDGFDSYHELQPWGMDVMKVGKSLGLGTLGTFQEGHAIRVDKTDSVTCAIEENGVVYSSIRTNYYGWQVAGQKVNINSRLTIHGGTRLTHQRVTVQGTVGNLCTGIVKDKDARLITSTGDLHHFGYIATYGKQSLNKDNLGLAVFFKAGDFSAFTEDEFSHIVRFQGEAYNPDYYFMAAWQLEPGGIHDEAGFVAYLKTVSALLQEPVKIKITLK